jgi:uncharacterized protein (TIGR03382 family)
MKRTLAVSAALALGMFTSLAHADSVQSDTLDVRPNPFAVPGEAPRAIYRWTDPALQGTELLAPAAVSHVIFMNNCLPNGCSLHPGNDNSTTDTSSIPNGNSVVAAYTGGTTNWNNLVACVRQAYAPFNVQIVDTRPAAGTNYHMAIVAGRAANVGEPSGVLGVSPFSCGYIPNAISFTFANEEPTNIADLCWTVSQETAHSWGLDHKFDNRDPMTYLSTGPVMKTFQNQAGACGEYNARQCSCTYQGTGSAQMNSYALIAATFGSSAPDTTKPTVTITTPTNNASVMAGFPVRADITDDIGVSKAELRIDGTLISTVNGAPWVFNAPTTIGQGSHHVEVTGYDLSNNSAKAAIDVSIGTVCTATGCADPNQVCVDGHCVAGPGANGGLGSACTANADCASGQCASDGTNKYCVEPCDPAKDMCPSGFGCLAAGTAGVCWPGAGAGGGGGGCNTGDQGGTILLGLGFAALLITRRRR